MTGWLELNQGTLEHRLAAFNLLADLCPPVPVIVETGSLRSPGNVAGDGNATMLFDELTAATGIVHSIDIDAVCGRNIAEHCGSQVVFHQWDSVKALQELRDVFGKVDILYLDSLDVDFANDELAARHALHEVQAATPMLKRSSIVAVDDNNPDGRGKGRLVSEYAVLKGWPLLLDGYVKVWSCRGDQ